jgi:hypothetical protein
MGILKANRQLTSEEIVIVSMVKPAAVENVRSVPELQNMVFARGT